MYYILPTYHLSQWYPRPLYIYFLNEKNHFDSMYSSSLTSPEQSKLYQTLKQGDDRRKQIQSKLQVSLFKQKELLKKDILKKRALLEKELQIDIQVCILK